MRLICPNCDAQYEVAESAIPESGRDVQCSACGHTWFQQSAAALAAASDNISPPVAPEADVPMTAPAMAEPSAARFDPPLPEDLPDMGADDPVSALPEAQPPAEEPSAEEPARPAAASRTIDESVMAVLREEAEREVRARANDAPPLEVQEELPLVAAAAQKTAPVRKIVVRANDPADEEPAEKPDDVVGRAGKGRDLLPDIEEINSTLSPANESGAGMAAAAQEARRSSGFRRGFMFALFLGMLALAAYVTAPRIVQRFPAAETAITAYVGGVDVLRLKLDGLMRTAIDAIQG